MLQIEMSGKISWNEWIGKDGKNGKNEKNFLLLVILIGNLSIQNKSADMQDMWLLIINYIYYYENLKSLRFNFIFSIINYMIPKILN